MAAGGAVGLHHVVDLLALADGEMRKGRRTGGGRRGLTGWRRRRHSAVGERQGQPNDRHYDACGEHQRELRD